MLAVIASIAPLLGLLGTIFGMIDAFQTVAVSGEALGRTESLAKGIYQAMITTAAGLMVAIPVLIGYHWLAGKIDRLVGEMDRMTVEFVEQHALARAQQAGVVRKEASKPAMRVTLDGQAVPPPQVAGDVDADAAQESAVAQPGA
jgi:biopolymer transport protein ExbB